MKQTSLTCSSVPEIRTFLTAHCESFLLACDDYDDDPVEDGCGPLHEMEKGTGKGSVRTGTHCDLVNDAVCFFWRHIISLY